MYYIKKQEQKNLFFLLAVSLFLFINYFLSNDIVSLFCTIVSCIYILVCKVNLLIPTIVYLTFFSYIFRFNDYNLYVFVCVVFVIRLLFFRKRNFIAGIIGIPLYIFFHLLSTNIGELTLTLIVPFVSIICLYFSATEFKIYMRDKCIAYFILAHFLSSFFGLFKENCRLQNVFNTTYISVSSWQDTIRFSGISFDPNFYTIISVIVLFIIVFKLKEKLKFILWIILIGIDIAFGLMTYSKSFYFCTACILICAILSTEKTMKIKLFQSLPVIIIAIFLMSNQIDNIFNGFMSRFIGVTSVNSLTTGRENLWIMYIKLIFKDISSVIVGNGILNNGLKAAHNTYLEMLYKFGIIGVVEDILYLIICRKKFFYASSKNIASVLIVVLFLFLLFNLSAYTFYGLWLCIFIIWVANMDKSNGEQSYEC